VARKSEYFLLVPRYCVARNRGTDFVQHLIPLRSARRNKALDPAALVRCPQASPLPSAVLAGQRRDYACYELRGSFESENLQQPG
jgi:hypothetical protein